jgi:hypothetical protein
MALCSVKCCDVMWACGEVEMNLAARCIGLCVMNLNISWMVTAIYFGSQKIFRSYFTWHLQYTKFTVSEFAANFL